MFEIDFTADGQEGKHHNTKAGYGIGKNTQLGSKCRRFLPQRFKYARSSFCFSTKRNDRNRQRTAIQSDPHVHLC